MQKITTAEPDDAQLEVALASLRATLWREEAVAAPYRTTFVESDGAKIHYQSWGDASKPGLLLVHGNGAHAHWFDFIAPYLTHDYHVVAMTLSGMGDSGWHDT